MPTIHFVLLGAFLLVTSLLLLTSSGGLRRAPDVELFWRDVRAHAFPVGPVIFVALMVLLIAASITIDLGIHPIIPAGYLAGGVIWLMASILTAAVVVTQHGVIIYKRSARHRVSWRQVTDYFKFESGSREGYVLFYMSRDGKRHRVEIAVPKRHLDQFERLLSQYLNTRLERLPEATIGDSRKQR